MGKNLGRIFKQRFEDRFEVIYMDVPLQGEEGDYRKEKIAEAVKALMAAALNREPTQEEVLGIVPIALADKRG